VIGDFTMLIDCATCVARGRACSDCVVTVLLNRPPLPVDLDDEEQAAIEQLSDAGLVPPLRLVPLADPGAGIPPDDAAPRRPPRAAAG
jgi:hypothetical protein